MIHAFFSPGPRQGARAALARLDIRDGPMLLFVGRIQPLKGLDVAVRTQARWKTHGPCWWWSVAPAARRTHGGRAHRQAGGVAGGGRSHPVHRPAAPPPAVDLLPRRRRGARSQPQRVLRPCGPGGGGLWHAGHRGGRRRAAHAGGARPHGVPGPRPPGVRGVHGADPHQSGAGPRAGGRRRRSRSQLHLVHRRRPAAAHLRRPHRAVRPSPAPPTHRAPRHQRALAEGPWMYRRI